MATRRALVEAAGVKEEIINTDTLEVGAGIDTAATIDNALKASGSARLVLKSATNRVDIQNAVTLGTPAAGTGVIDLSNGTGSRFKIAGTPVGDSVTAGNLTNLTSGMYLMTSLVPGIALIDANTLGLTTGFGVYLSSNKAYSHARADLAGTAKFSGICLSADATAGVVQVSGLANMPFPAGLGVVNGGDIVYLSATVAGKFTNVAPSASGNLVVPVGYVYDGSTYNNGIGGSCYCVLMTVFSVVLA